MNQKAATNRKLSQGSPVVHDRSPTSLFKGTINGCEYAKALVTCGGVASKSGDFWCTRIVERCRVEENEFEVGEKAATVGGLVVLVVLDSLLSGAECPAFADVDEVSDMEVIQGVSVVLETCQRMFLLPYLSGCCPERMCHAEDVISAPLRGSQNTKIEGTCSGNCTHQGLP